MREIPILLYQNIGNYPENMMEDGLSPQAFERQMNFLSENGYSVVTLAQALKHMNRRLRLSPKSIALTIDGGYQDAFTNCLPVLEKYGFQATFFIPPESIGKERAINGEPIECLSWKEVHEIMGKGMGVGLLAYHGRGIRVHYDETAIKQSVEQAMKIMDREIEAPIRYCAFREGVPKKPLWEFLQTRGFDAVFTQTPTNRRAEMDSIGRIQVDDDDQNIFLTKISKTYLFFKDKPSWKYIRRYAIDKLAHRISETLNRLKGDNG